MPDECYTIKWGQKKAWWESGTCTPYVFILGKKNDTKITTIGTNETTNKTIYSPYYLGAGYRLK